MVMGLVWAVGVVSNPFILRTLSMAAADLDQHALHSLRVTFFSPL